MKKILFILFVLSVGLKISAQQKIFNYALGGSNFSSQDVTQQSNTIEKILIQNNVIWLASSKGLSKSTDTGNTWTNYYNSNDFKKENVSFVAFGLNAIWASTWHYEFKAGSNVPVGTGLRYSSDQGQTWAALPQPVDNPGDSSIVYGINKIRALPVTVPEQNFIYDIAFTKNTIWIAAFAGGLRKSTDMGKTWQRIILPPDNLNSIKPADTLKFSLQPIAGNFGKESYLNHRVFSILTIDDNTIYVGTAGGINKSIDGGISWTKFNHINQAKPISGNFVLSLEKNDFDNSIWAGTWKAEGNTEYWGVSCSKDGGQSWETFLTDERALDFGFKYFGQQGNYLSADIFVAAQNGLFRSSNNGLTWISAPEIIDDSKNVSLTTKHFRSVKVNKSGDGSYDIWMGTLNGLAKLNETSGFWNGKWKVFLASKSLSGSNESYAFPNPFSPNREIVRIKYSTNQPSSISLRILDFGMNLVKTVVQNALRSASDNHFEIWDGKDESGKYVPNGVYFYRIDTSGGTAMYGKIMVMQ